MWAVFDSTHSDKQRALGSGRDIDIKVIIEWMFDVSAVSCAALCRHDYIFINTHPNISLISSHALAMSHVHVQCALCCRVFEGLGAAVRIALIKKKILRRRWTLKNAQKIFTISTKYDEQCATMVMLQLHNMHVAFMWKNPPCFGDYTDDVGPHSLKKTLYTSNPDRILWKQQLWLVCLLWQCRSTRLCWTTSSAQLAPHVPPAYLMNTPGTRTCR